MLSFQCCCCCFALFILIYHMLLLQLLCRSGVVVCLVCHVSLVSNVSDFRLQEGADIWNDEVLEASHYQSRWCCLGTKQVGWKNCIICSICVQRANYSWCRPWLLCGLQLLLWCMVEMKLTYCWIAIVCLFIVHSFVRSSWRFIWYPLKIFLLRIAACTNLNDVAVNLTKRICLYRFWGGGVVRCQWNIYSVMLLYLVYCTGIWYENAFQTCGDFSGIE